MSFQKYHPKEGFPGGSQVQNLPSSAGDSGSVPGSGRCPEEQVAAHSGVLAWESRGQRSLAAAVHGLQGVGHDLVTKQQQTSLEEC